MPLIVVYDPASLGVSNRVVRYHVSKPEPELDAFADGLPYLVGPVLPDGFTGSNSRVDAGNVVLLNQEELDAIDSAQAAADAASLAVFIAAVKEAFKARHTTSTDIDAVLERIRDEVFVELVVGQFNLIRGWLSRPLLTEAQVKQAFRDAIVEKVNALS